MKIPRKKKHVVLHRDNVPPHVERRFVESIANKDWGLLPHQPYSPTKSSRRLNKKRKLASE